MLWGRGSTTRSAARARVLLAAVVVLSAAIAGSPAAARAPARNATVAGYVQLCGGPAPGGCFIAPIGICEPPKGCVTSDRVIALSQAGRVVATQKLRHARFRLHLAPGRYTIELVGDGKHVTGRVMQRQTAIARPHRTTVVRFFFGVP